MTDRRPTDDELRARRAALDAKLGPDPREDGPEPPASSRSDLARGLKLSSEFIAGVVVGAGLGWFIDSVAGTSPFGLIVFLLLGFGAGILNVLRETGAVATHEDRLRAERERSDPRGDRGRKGRGE